MLAPDLPGHGNSATDISLSYSIGSQVVRIKEMLAALKVKRVHVIASSMGGAIALQLAAREPELVASLVLIGTVGVQAEASWLQEHISQTGANPMVHIRNKQDYLVMMCIGMARPSYMPGFILSALARSYISRLAIKEKIAAEIAGDLDQSDVLGTITCPALIIWGSQDKVSYVSNARLLHGKLASSRSELIDGTGHVPMVEAPQQWRPCAPRFSRNDYIKMTSYCS